MNKSRERMLNARRAFTLVEVMVVVVILAILSGLVLSGLAAGRRRGKVDTTRAVVRRLNMAIMDRYENYEDLVGGSQNLLQIRQRMREEMPDSWQEVFGAPNSQVTVPTTPAGRAYGRYYAAGAAPTPLHESAECLFMIITQSGMFPDVLADIRPDRIGDIDNDGKKEFWDGWNRPIAFLRWAPGFTSPLSPIQIADPVNYHDPIDVAEIDGGAFAMFPLVYSAGPDEAVNDPNSTTGPSGYGLTTAAMGWPDAVLVPPSPSSLCSFTAGGTVLVGSPDPARPTAYRDNISGHDLLGN